MSTSEYSSETSSQATSTVDPDEISRAKREIQGIVQQIADLSRSDVTVEQFYEEFLGKVVSALAASGGAVWGIGGGALQLIYQINLRQTGLLEDPLGQEKHGRLLQQVLQSPEGAIVPPHSGYGGSHLDAEHAPANTTEFLLVLAAVANDQGPQAIVEVFQRPGARAATQAGYKRFLLQTCELAGDFLRSRRLAHLTEKQSLWEQLESFTRTAHETLDTRAAAYTIANEGRRLIGCDRVSVALMHGNRVTIEAVSGQDTFDKRANVVTLLRRLAKAVCKTADEVWYTGDATDLAPQVEKAIDAYVDESHTKQMAVLPLFPPEAVDEGPAANKPKRKKVIGALIVEQMVDTTPSEGYRQRVAVVQSHSATAIANALEHNSLFLMPVWKTLGKATSLFRGRTLPKTVAVVAGVAALVWAGLFWQWDFNLQGEGRLKPDVLRHVFARMPGEVDQVFVQHNSLVKQGDPLVKQRSLPLEKELQALLGAMAETNSELRSVERQLVETSELSSVDEAQLAARASEIRVKLSSMQSEIEKVEQMQALLVVTSPIDGIVITWKNQIEQLNGRPVQEGQSLLEVADPAREWYLEVLMPEKQMRHVGRAWSEANVEGKPLTVKFFLATNPDVQFTGTVDTIDNAAQARGEDGNTVKLDVRFADGELRRLRELLGGDPKVGGEATVKVFCGTEPVGYVLLHDLIDFLQAKLIFPWF